MILESTVMSYGEIIRTLGYRFRDYRMRLNMTRKEVSERTAISMTTLYKFETGHMADMSMVTLLKLLRVTGLLENWQQILPDLPESPYLYKEEKKIQRIRHPRK